jgi:hypothetical protein
MLAINSFFTCGMAAGKYNPLSGACPFIVASLKFTSGDFLFKL